MPVYDLKCSQCETEEEMMLKMDEDIPVCPVCGDKRTKVCNCSHFKLIYNNKMDSCSWGNEGYASSQYYRNVKGDN